MNKQLPIENKNIIWHYTNMSVFLSILENGNMYFSNVSYLNDKDELVWLKKTYDQVKKKTKRTSLSKEEIKNCDEAFAASDMQDRLSCFASCFSSEPDMLSQWRAYANDGEGIAIGFNKDMLIKNINDYYGEKNITIFSNSVSYIDENFRLKQIYDLALEKCDSIRDQYSYSNDKKPINFFSSFFIKNKAFQEEKEYRLVYNSSSFHSDENQNIKPKKKFRTGKSGRIIPFFEIKIDKNKKVPIVDIVLGPRNDNTTDSIKKILFEHNYITANVKKSIAAYRK